MKLREVKLFLAQIYPNGFTERIENNRFESKLISLKADQRYGDDEKYSFLIYMIVLPLFQIIVAIGATMLHHVVMTPTLPCQK